MSERDPVDHYMRGGLECIDAMRAISTPEEFRGYLKLTAFKYLWRLGQKDLPEKEAKKAKDYITWLHEELVGLGAEPEPRLEPQPEPDSDPTPSAKFGHYVPNKGQVQREG